MVWSNLLFLLAISNVALSAADAAFLGRDSCSSSGCHGGAGANQNQSLVWSRQDAHARAAATLTTARSKRIAQVLKIPDASSDRACTSCHSPMQGLTADLWQPHSKVELQPASEAVSCESCHGPAKIWIRSHTRTDLSRTQKALDGLRDLTLFYNRANACVGCHQVIEPRLLNAGHPELIFELDGQSTAMPRHWKEAEAQFNTKGWLVGQAAALREVTAQLLAQKRSGSVAPQTFQQWQSLFWIVTRASPEHRAAAFKTNAVQNAEELEKLHQATDELARSASVRNYTEEEKRKIVARLLESSSEFDGVNKGDLVAATRAERLVIALERLAGSPAREHGKANGQLVLPIFDLVQSRVDFDPARFRAELLRLRSGAASTE